MQILFEELAFLIVIWFLRIIDGLMQLFNAFCGIANVYTSEGEETKLLDAVFASNRIMQIFWSVVIIAVFLLALFSIAALIRNMIKNDKRVSDIMGKVLISVVGIFAVMALVILGIMLCDELVVILDDALKGESNLTFAQTLLDTFVGHDNWNKGCDASQVSFGSGVAVSEILGDPSKGLFGIWPKGWKGDGMVKNPTDIYYLPALVGVIVVAWYLFMTTMSLGRRCFELVFEYFCMPPAFACMPLDDGARVKNWTESFIGRLVVVFGYILSVNVFTIVMPEVISLEITTGTTVSAGFVNCLFRVILCCSGAALIPMGGRLFERIFVSREEAFFDGGRNGGAVMAFHQMSRMAERGVHTITHGAKSGVNAINARGDKKSQAAASEAKDRQEGAYRDQVLGGLAAISGNTGTSAANTGALASAQGFDIGGQRYQSFGIEKGAEGRVNPLNDHALPKAPDTMRAATIVAPTRNGSGNSTMKPTGIDPDLSGKGSGGGGFSAAESGGGKGGRNTLDDK